MFTVEDASVKTFIIREQVSTPTAQSNEVLSTIGGRASSVPASQFWETYSKLAPGHFYSHDLLQTRADLLRGGICPQVQLSGIGIQGHYATTIVQFTIFLKKLTFA